MKIHRSFAVSLFTVFAAAGCAASPEEDTGTLTEWLGESPHFAVYGTFDGKPMNHRMEGAAAKGLRCSRTYSPLPGAKPNAEGKYDTSQMYFVKKELGVVVEIDGKPTDISVGYWRHDLAAGRSLDVIPRERGSTIPEGKTWVDFELKDPGADGPTGVEKAAEGGTLVMELNSGAADEGGVFIATGGRTGVFATINWGPQESLTISATSDCQDAAVVMWANSVIPP